MKILICDIDNTICDSRERMDKLVKKYGSPELWPEKCVREFLNSKKVKRDKLIPGAELLPAVIEKTGAKLIILTGRNEMARKTTRMWLKNNLDIGEDIPLIMRDLDDFSAPDVCKEKLFLDNIFTQYQGNTFMFLEDDQDVLAKFKRYGLVLRTPEIWDFIRDLLK